MKALFCLAVILMGCSSLITTERMSAITYANAVDISLNDLADASKLLTNLTGAFDVFKANFKRTYNSADAEQKSFMNFAANLANAVALSQGNPLATFGVTPYSDLSEEQFKAFLTPMPTYAPSADAENASNNRRAVDADGLPIRPDVIYDRASGKILTPRVPVAFEDLPSTFKNKKWREGHKEDAPSTTADEAARRAFGIQADTPTKFDWRTQGVITPIKYQGECGGCWAFAVTGNIESLWAIAGHPLTPLSDQQLISCDTGNDACDGGIMQNAYQWILKSNDGYIAREDYYPYESADKFLPKCNNEGAGAGAKITNYIDIQRRETEILKYVANVGPVAVAIEAYGWQHYTGGIITKSNMLMTTHAVLAVGYDTANDPPYWILKNQWSEAWGENGYVRIKLGSNVCMITDNPSTAVVATDYNLQDLPSGAPERRVRATRNDAPTPVATVATAVAAAAAVLGTLVVGLL